MTDSLINSLDMTNTTTAFLDKNSTILGTNTKVATLIEAINATVTRIGRTATTQSLNTYCATLSKSG